MILIDKTGYELVAEDRESVIVVVAVFMSFASEPTAIWGDKSPLAPKSDEAAAYIRANTEYLGYPICSGSEQG